MSFRDQIPDEALDATEDELREIEGFPNEELKAEDEFREHIGEIHEAFEVYMGTILINRMFDDGYLTLGEYLDLMEYTEEYERDLETTLL
jgi:hypothetical protein